MTLPMSRAELAPVAAMASRTRLADLFLGQRLRQVLGQDRDLRLFLRGEVLATATTERFDRFAARLDLATEDGQELVLGQRMRLRFSTL